jgi:O-antigen ligase
MKRQVFVRSSVSAVIFLLPAYLIRFNVFGIPTNALELLLLAALMVWIFWDYRDFVGVVKRFPYKIPLLLLFSGLFLSAVVGDNFKVSLGIIKGWFVVPVCFSFLVLGGAFSDREKEKLLMVLYYSAAAVSLIAISYYLCGFLTYDGRVRAFWESPNHLAMYISPGLILGFERLFLNKKRNGLGTLILESLAFGLTGSVLYLTYSYAAWIAVLLGIGAMIAVSKANNLMRHLKTILSIFFVLLVVLLSQSQNDKFIDLVELDSRSSLASRIMIWESSLRIIQDDWFLGIGSGNFQSKYLEYQKHFPPYLEWAVPQPHSIFLAFWLQSGIVGLAGFVWLVLRWLVDCWRKIKRNAGKNHISYILFGVMIYFLLHGLVDTTYWKNDLAMMFWFILILL